MTLPGETEAGHSRAIFCNSSQISVSAGMDCGGNASDRNLHVSGQSSHKARSPLRLSLRIAGFLGTGIRATDGGRRVMIPEML
jgi:hypothetical protein